MSDPFIGEIKMFGGNFAPRNYALSDGQLLAISQNQALFSLLGTMPIHKGQGPGLPNFNQGQRAGGETDTITLNEMPAHGHTPRVSSAPGSNPVPVGRVPATAPVNAFSAAAPDTDLAPAIDPTTARCCSSGRSPSVWPVRHGGGAGWSSNSWRCSVRP